MTKWGKQAFGEWGLRIRDGKLEMHREVEKDGSRAQKDGEASANIYTGNKMGIWGQLGIKAEWVEGEELLEKLWKHNFRQKANISTHRISLYVTIKEGPPPTQLEELAPGELKRYLDQTKGYMPEVEEEEREGSTSGPYGENQDPQWVKVTPQKKASGEHTE